MKFSIIRCWSVVLFCLSATGFGGCTSSPTHTGPTASGPETKDQEEQLFEWSVNVLNHLDEYNAITATPEVLERLNQWIVEQRPLPNWKVDPLVATLPKEFQELPQLQGLDNLSFHVADDVVPLLEAIWMRDIAKAAVGNETQDVARAKRLFDWTVRNIQLDPDEKAGKYHYLANVTLIFGHGTAQDRAWIFTLLARQQGLDVVMLALPDQDKEGKPRPWLPALFSDGQLYLFDARLGLPIPAPGSHPLLESTDGPKAERSVNVATLAQAATDESVLKQMDLPEAPYPVKSSDLSKVVSLIEATPMYLTQRMQLFESHLSGDRRIVLMTQPSRVAEKVKTCPQIAEAQLWLLPMERYGKDAAPESDRQRAEAYLEELKPFHLSRLVKVRGAKFTSESPLTVEDFKRDDTGKLPNDRMKQVAALWQARVMHLIGKYTGPESATELYMVSRPYGADIDQDFTPEQKKYIPVAKQDATYWLGLIAFERGHSTGKTDHYITAIDYLDELTLKKTPNSFWIPGAHYNLGRTYEALGKNEQAIAAYRADKSSPQKEGNLLRAKWLEEKGKK